MMLMHHTLLWCLWQLENNRGLSWDLSYLIASLSVFLSHFQVTPNWGDQLICLRAEQPSRGTHRGGWTRLRGTPWHSTAPEFSTKLQWICRAAPKHLTTESFPLTLITHFPYLKLRKPIYECRNSVDSFFFLTSALQDGKILKVKREKVCIDIRHWLQHCTPNLIKV